jgi:hypothetical protein
MKEMAQQMLMNYSNVSVLIEMSVSLVRKVSFVLLFVIQASFSQEAVPSWKHDLFYSADLCVIGSVKDMTGKKEENYGLDIKLEELLFTSMEPLSIGNLVRISDDRPVLGTKNIKVTEFKYQIKTADGWRNIRRFEKLSGENQILLIRVDLSEKMDSLKLILINVIPIEDIAIVRKILQERVALELKLHRSLGLDLKFKQDEKNDRKLPE